MVSKMVVLKDSYKVVVRVVVMAFSLAVLTVVLKAFSWVALKAAWRGMKLAV